MKKIYIVFGFLMLIAVMLLLNRWQSSDWQKSLLQNALPELKTINSATTSDYKEFLSSDGKFKITYPDSWLITENQSLLSAMALKDWQEKYGLKTLFMVQTFQTGKFAQLMVQEGVFDLSAEEIIKAMKTINQKQDLNMEIVKSETQDDKTIFEARYSTANSPALYSKEEILSAEEKTYLIAFITLEKDLPDFSAEIDAIFNSVEVVR